MNQRLVHTFYAGKHVIKLGVKTCIMGIINCSEDSFSGDGFSLSQQSSIIRYALGMVKHGADILDIGGESTRPGAQPVNIQVEIKRVSSVIRILAQKIPIPISVDTYKPAVAKAALEAGASIVNTVRGSSITSAMIQVVKQYRAGLILMHSRGTPATMHNKIKYKNVITDVSDELIEAVKKCLDLGIEKDRIIIDPGIGFSKDAHQSLLLVHHIARFSSLGYPILVGPSRKSFLGKIVDKNASNRVWATAAAVSFAITHGVHAVRVHDVAKMRDVVDTTDAIMNVR